MKKITIVLALLFATLLFPCAMPISAFALPQNGDDATTDYQNTLVGSDGKGYYRTGTQVSFQYLSDGSTKKFRHVNYSGPRRHYLVKMADQNNYYGYCIEQGVSFPDNQTYRGSSYQKDNYFRVLPESARSGIMLATIFGRQPGKSVPVAGCNDDDWYWATQVILWEYQQKLRTSPTSIKTNGLVPSDYFFSTLKGRPAEKCYHYMLTEMEKYRKIPSFTSSKSSTAKTQVLHWNSKSALWEATLVDANKLNVALKLVSGKITIIRKGSSYILQSKTKMPLTTLGFQKQVELPSHEMLIWGSGTSSQALVTGTADPIFFFLKVRTEENGTFDLLKTSEDGKKSGFRFQMTDENKTVYKGTTDGTGKWQISLPAGKYTLLEEKAPDYKAISEMTVVIKEKQTTKIEVKNILEKGFLTIQKNFKNPLDGSTGKEWNATFQVYSSKYDKYEETPPLWRAQITTDKNGLAKTGPLPLGEYVVHQVAAGQNLAVSEDISATIPSVNENISINVENIQQRGRFLLKKIDGEHINNPVKGLKGATFEIRAAEDIHGPDGKQLIKRGTIVSTVVTDGEGIALSSWLNPGLYEIIETKAPMGYEMPHNPVATTLLVSNDQMEATFTKEIIIKNEKRVIVPKTADPFNDGNNFLWGLVVFSSAVGVFLTLISNARRESGE